MFDLVLAHILTASTVDQGAIKTTGSIPSTGAFLSLCLCGFSPATPDFLTQSENLRMKPSENGNCQCVAKVFPRGPAMN